MGTEWTRAGAVDGQWEKPPSSCTSIWVGDAGDDDFKGSDDYSDIFTPIGAAV